MRTLFRVEVRRFTARRAVRVLAGVLLVLIVAGASLTFAFSNRDFEAATARERAHVTADYEACEAECERPDLDSIRVDPRFHLSALADVLAGLGGNLIVIALVFGATFIGAEWHHRTMTVALTWESRRARVALSKIAACAAVVFVATVAIQVLLSGALVPAAVFRGTMEGTTAAWLGQTVGVGLRIAVVASFAASLGAALAFIARNTAFAIGVSFLWLAILEGIVRGTRPGWARWLIGDNVASFVDAGTTGAVRSASGAGLLLSLYVVGLGWIAVASFRRRDVA
jgi:ABC-type transport system involved in multi-copper enzyme maturation permease subunit